MNARALVDKCKMLDDQRAWTKFSAYRLCTVARYYNNIKKLNRISIYQPQTENIINKKINLQMQ